MSEGEGDSGGGGVTGLAPRGVEGVAGAAEVAEVAGEAISAESNWVENSSVLTGVLRGKATLGWSVDVESAAIAGAKVGSGAVASDADIVSGAASGAGGVGV